MKKFNLHYKTLKVNVSNEYLMFVILLDMLDIEIKSVYMFILYLQICLTSDILNYKGRH